MSACKTAPFVLEDRRTAPAPFSFACLGAFALFAALALIIALLVSKTTDEQSHLEYGKRILNAEPARSEPRFDSKMPVTALNAAPSALADLLNSRGLLPGLASALSHWRVPRVITIGAGLLLLAVLGHWAYLLYGRSAAIAALILTALSPNILAHTTLVTTDVYCALGFAAALYGAWRMSQDPGIKTAAAASLLFAFAQTVKPFVVYLYVIVPLCLLPALLFRRPLESRTKLRRMSAAYAVMAIVASILILNIAFRFDRTFTPLRDYRFQSTLFATLSSTPVLSGIPIPTPYPYLHGLDMTLHHERNGISFGNIYLLGDLRLTKQPGARPFPLYYAAGYLFKEPLALQLLVLIGFWRILRKRDAVSFFENEWFFLAPIAIVILLLSFFNLAQIGVRHALPAFALSILLASAAFHGWEFLSRGRKSVLAVLVGLVAVSAASYFPHYIPYMNELTPDRRYLWKVLADGNLSWGQNKAVVDEFLRENPEVQHNPSLPAAGFILVEANHLVGVVGNPKDYQWLRQNCKPVRHVGHGHLLFKLSTQNGAMVCEE